MSHNESKFDIWWNSPKVKRVVGVIYSLGAAIVIIGAMFKILHLPGASYVLGGGMTVEAFLFFLGIFDKPHKEFDWHRIFDFESDEKLTAAPSSSVPAAKTTNLSIASLNDDDVSKLSEGIKKLSTTAQQFSSLSNVMTSTEEFSKNIDSASKATGKFVQNQEALSNASSKLTQAYAGITTDMDEVVKNTKSYSSKVEEVTKNLSSVNSIYEIQLKNIQSQSEIITKQTEQIKQVNTQLEKVFSDTQKINAATFEAVKEADKFKDNASKLAKQVADLNQVYGNMLNSMN